MICTRLNNNINKRFRVTVCDGIGKSWTHENRDEIRGVGFSGKETDWWSDRVIRVFFSFAVPSQSELIVFGPKPIGPFTRVEHGPLRRDQFNRHVWRTDRPERTRRPRAPGNGGVRVTGSSGGETVFTRHYDETAKSFRQRVPVYRPMLGAGGGGRFRICIVGSPKGSPGEGGARHSFVGPQTDVHFFSLHEKTPSVRPAETTRPAKSTVQITNTRVVNNVGGET